MRRGIAYCVSGFVIGFVFCYFLLSFVFAPTITSVFSPDNGDQIIDLIDSAEKSIEIEMYVFTSRDVIEALERAKMRGVIVRIIIERNTIGGTNEDIYHELLSKGFNTKYATKSYKLTHSKFIIIDKKIVFVGSHNLSNSAIYNNREASVIIRDSNVIQNFIDVFERDWMLAY